MERNLQIIKEYNEGKSGTFLEKKWKLNHSTIYRILQKNNVPRRSQSHSHQKYKIDENAFENVDCEWKAYFLGLCYADGCLTNGAIRINLISEDDEILRQLNYLIYPNKDKPLIYCPPPQRNKKEKPITVLQIKNKKMYNDLKKIGLTERKTFTLKFPSFEKIPKNIFHHFLRGYFDGDGCLITNSSRLRWSVTSSQIFTKKLKTFLKVELDIISWPQRCGDKGMINLEIYKKADIIKVCKYMYLNSTIFLKRKWERYCRLN